MSISRRSFIKGATIAGTASVLSPTVFANNTNSVVINKPTNPKNILIITADQLAKKAVAG